MTEEIRLVALKQLVERDLKMQTIEALQNTPAANKLSSFFRQEVHYRPQM